MRSLPETRLAELFGRVDAAEAQRARAYPGEPGGRQPVHTVYVPADRFAASTAAEQGREALRLLDTHAPDGAALRAALDLALDERAAQRVRDRVAAKLASEPVEDLRIDFEDGYGRRADDEEDRHAVATAGAVAAARADGLAPPFIGLRVKSFADGLARRSVRTLDVFLTALLDAAGGVLPTGLRITFPKIVAVEHVAAFADVLAQLERAVGLPERSLGFEAQVETTQSIVDRDGRLTLPRLVDAAGGRLAAAHFGTFDYTAACGLAPAEQRITHPACDFARHVMQVSLAGRGVQLSDGSTNVVPASDDRTEVHRVWRLHATHVTHSLRHGYVQGWDLHPAQLPSRYAAVYAFVLGDLDDALERLRRWHTGSGGAGVVDEPATVRALAAQVRRAVDCGAIDLGEAATRAAADERLFSTR